MIRVLVSGPVIQAIARPVGNDARLSNDDPGVGNGMGLLPKIRAAPQRVRIVFVRAATQSHKWLARINSLREIPSYYAKNALV